MAAAMLLISRSAGVLANHRTILFVTSEQRFPSFGMYDHGAPSSPSTAISFPLCAKLTSAGDRKMILALECDYCDDSESYNQIQFGNANNLRLTLRLEAPASISSERDYAAGMSDQWRRSRGESVSNLKPRPHLLKTNICIRL